MWLVSWELIFPGGFLPWRVVTSRLTEHTACMMEGKTPIGRVLSSSVCWDGMTDWRFWRVLGRPIGEMHAGQCHATIFPDFSPVTAAKRKSLVPVLRSMTALGLQPYLAYPAVIKLRHEGEQRCFSSLRKAEDFVGSLSQSGTFAADPQGSGRAAAALSSIRLEGLGDRYGGDGGGRDMDDC